ncbi:MAG: acyltransferase family protein [Candidatus Sulfotelmatobacter sp.]
MRRSFSSNLDFLRTVAVLLVLAQHLTRRATGEAADSIATSFLGLFGVLIFFVHTSLVLMYSMERSGLGGTDLARNFYIRRIFRIYPLSILAVLAAVALHLNSNINGIAGLSHGPLPGWKSILSQILLAQNLVRVKSIVNVLWSLPFELQMYLFLPFIFMWVRGRSGVRALFLLWVASLGAAWIQPHIGWLKWASLLRFVPCFLPGIIAFVLPPIPRLRSFLWPVFVLGLVVAFTLRPTVESGWFLCLLLGMGMPFFQEIQSGWLRTASHQIATYSYGIYVSHQFCIWFALSVLAGWPFSARIGALLSSLVIVPIVLYHALEKPMIGVGVRLADRVGEKKDTEIPAAA